MCVMDLLAAGTSVLETLNGAGYEAYFVGGMVRDRLIGRPIYDVDITTSATPDTVMSLFDKTIATGLQHGTVTVMIGKIPVEVTTFRVESHYIDYRRPKEVRFTRSLDEDLRRRDFTINAIAMDREGQLLDPIGGREDLEKSLIVCVGKPTERFQEDPLRILRGIRFVSKLGFSLEAETLAAMIETKELLQQISMERVKKELEGMVKGDFFQKAMNDAYEMDLMSVIPFFNGLNKYRQRCYEAITHPIILFALAGLTCDNLAEYLAAWPFSRVERKCIEVLCHALNQEVDPTYFTYLYGEEWARFYHQMKLFIHQENVPYQVVDLPISDRRELLISGKVIAEVIQRPKGPWIQELLRKIEYLVVMNQLKNEKETLIQYIENEMEEADDE